MKVLLAICLLLSFMLPGASAQQKNGVISEGERRSVDVMIKDSNLYKSTGGWRFERFFGAQKAENAIKNSGNSCFQCHSKADKHGFVFSQLH